MGEHWMGIFKFLNIYALFRMLRKFNKSKIQFFWSREQTIDVYY